MPYCEASPPISASIHEVRPNTFFLGSLYVCEVCDSPDVLPDDAVTHWKENNFIRYLRPTGNELPSLDSIYKRFYGDTSSGIWSIGQVMIKVSSSLDQTPEEGKVIEFIAEHHPEIPVTQIIFHWRDPKLERAFMIMRPAKGIRLDLVWHSMSDLEKEHVADEVAAHVDTLTQHVSARLETIEKFGVKTELRTSLVGSIPLNTFVTWPSWKPWQQPPFTKEEFRAHIENISGLPPDAEQPEVDDFVLYNSDINPHNIFVSGGRLTQIIDWEYTAYWPRYWVATAPCDQDPWIIDTLDHPQGHWGLLLKSALKKRGFPSKDQWYKVFQESRDNLRSENAGPEYEAMLRALRAQSLEEESDDQS